MPSSKPTAEQILEDAEDRDRDLEEVRALRRSSQTLVQLRADNKILNRAVDVLEDHIAVRKALAKAIAKPPIIKYRKKAGTDAIIPICLNSDEHYDETFIMEHAGGINEQNPEIAEAKVHNYVRRLIGLIEREAISNPVPFMVMPFMGDMIAGELHDKDERVSPMAPIEAARFAYRMKRIIIDSLLASGPVERIIIPCVDGNHGRSTDKRTPGQNFRYSYEHDVYLRLADYYDDKDESRVQFYIPQADFAVLEIVPGFTLCITHGDSVKGGSGIGGLAPSLLKAVSRWRLAYPADLFCLGHFHQFFDLSSVIVNPSAVGYNPYAASKGLAPSPPAQLYTALHTGRMTRAMTAQIWVD